MHCTKRCCLFVALLVALGCVVASGAQAQIRYLESPDSLVQPGVPKGDLLNFKFTSQKYYPGSTCNVAVYIPAQYTGEKSACLCVGYDGPGLQARNVFDNLIFKKQMPVTIGVWVGPSMILKPGQKKPVRYIRDYQYDSVNGDFGSYVINEVMPYIEQQKTALGKPILISPDPSDHMAMGVSAGGIGSFTLAWEHPEFVRRVFSAIGSFYGIRGGDWYPVLIRKTEPKPIRVFQQDGVKDTWNPAFGDGYQLNEAVEESLRFAGYDVNHSWGVLGHEGSDATSVLPEALKWLWRDYPAPIVAGVSGNSFLLDTLVPGKSWQLLGGIAQPVAAVASDPAGSVYFADPAGMVYKLDDTGKTDKFVDTGSAVCSMAFDSSGALYVCQPSAGKVLQISVGGKKSVVVSGGRASHVIVDSKGRIYISEPGLHDDMPSIVWIIEGGKKTVIDKGLDHATGLLITPDRNRLLIAEGHTHWVHDGLLLPDGTIQFREHLYWLHVEESTADGDWADAGDMAMDGLTHLYVATRMGVQIGDNEARSAAILTLPGGAVTALCFGGKAFDTLYAVSGGRIYVRPMAHPTVPNFADIVTPSTP